MRIVRLPSKSGVYCIKNINNDKRLILYAKNMKHNASYYFIALDKGTNKGVIPKLQQEYDYDSSVFTVELLELTSDKNRRFYYIRKYSSDITGYNKKEVTPTKFYVDLKRVPGIYCIINNTNGKRYIGKSNDVRVRVRDHFGSLVKGKHFIKALQNDWNLGHEFTVDILEYTHNLTDREMYYIMEFDSYIESKGYNTLIGNYRVKNKKKKTQ